MKRLFRQSIRLITDPILGALSGLHRQLSGDAGRRRRRADRYASGMLSEFSRLGFTRKIRTAKKKTKRERVRFSYPLLLTADELWCPVDLARLPTGVRTDDLCDESVIRSIEDRLDTAVRIDKLANGKLCFVVLMAGSRFPEKLSINAFQMDPEASGLTVPFGCDAIGDHIAIDLIQLKHLLVTGSTGGGKTTFFHAMLSTLIQRNTADDLELWLIDLKRTEMALYKPLLGRRQQGGIVRHLATDPEAAIEVLDNCYREIVRRNTHMENMGASNIDDLARSSGQKLTRIVLMVDEFAMLTLDPTRMGKQSIGTIATNLMARIAALGRSAGVSIVIATQMVNKDVLSGIIRANFENRLAFSCADWRQSQLVVESSEADGLPPGRAVLRREGRTSMLQTCLITPRQVRIEVDRVSEFGPDGAWGEDAELHRFVREAKILIAAACQHYAGDMPRSKMLALDGVKNVIGQERFNEIAQRLERDGILEQGGPRKPRRVVRAFFGRPQLIEQFYGSVTVGEGAESAPTDTPTETGAESLRLGAEDTVGAHQDADQPKPAPDGDTVNGWQDHTTHAQAPDDPMDLPDDSEVPEVFKFSERKPESAPEAEED